MNRKSARYIEDFKVLILSLLKEIESKKFLEREFGVAVITIASQEKTLFKINLRKLLQLRRRT